MKRRFFLHTKNGKKLLIGESDLGWTFALHVNPSDSTFPQTLGEWKELFNDETTSIFDQHGSEWSAEDMCSFIQDRAWYAQESVRDHHVRAAKQKAQAGPNHLLRRRIRGTCVGHAKGLGTWDYVTTDFFN